YLARTNPNARLYSELAPHEVALEPPGTPRLHLRASAVTADPRLDWVAGTLGWRYRAWLPDSIYPFVWTLSGRPLSFAPPAGGACVLAAALPHGAGLRVATTTAVRGAWKRYAFAAPAGTLIPHGGDVTALADGTCPSGVTPPAPRSVFVFASGYDAGWRAWRAGRPVAPEVANGWMMAWDSAAASERLTYLPALLQLAGLGLMVVVLSVAVPLARRADARNPTLR
ncbi:MAG TPA: hypothetical protein VIJ77_00630, partial [Candidatus Tumulicola sp.]